MKDWWRHYRTLIWAEVALVTFLALMGLSIVLLIPRG